MTPGVAPCRSSHGREENGPFGPGRSGRSTTGQKKRDEEVATCGRRRPLLDWRRCINGIPTLPVDRSLVSAGGGGRTLGTVQRSPASP